MDALFFEIWAWVVAAGMLGLGTGYLIRRVDPNAPRLDDLRMQADLAEQHIVQRDREIETLREMLRDLRAQWAARDGAVEDGASTPDAAPTPSPILSAASSPLVVPEDFPELPDRLDIGGPDDDEDETEIAPRPAPPRIALKPDRPAEPDPTDRDDLKRIRGLGPLVERTLNGLGIWTYRDIIRLDDLLRSEPDVAPRLHARMQEEGWAVEARRLQDLKRGAAA